MDSRQQFDLFMAHIIAELEADLHPICNHCKVVPLERGQVNICSGCVADLIEWLEFAELQDQHKAQEQLYFNQFHTQKE